MKIKKDDIALIVTIFVFLAIIFMAVNDARAGGYNPPDVIVKPIITPIVEPIIEVPAPIIIIEKPVNEITEQTIINQSISNEIDRSTAIGIANNHQFNLAIPDLQWSVNTSGYRNSSAVSFSLGKKLNNLFIHGSFTNEDELGEQAYSVGVSGRF